MTLETSSHFAQIAAEASVLDVYQLVCAHGKKSRKSSLGSFLFYLKLTFILVYFTFKVQLLLNCPIQLNDL